MTVQNPLYLGTWILVPELSFYDEGEAPLNGRYQISATQTGVHVSIAWTTRDGTDHALEFEGPDNGSRQPVESDRRGPTYLAITRVSPAILDSSAYADTTLTAYARRRASADGRLLSTMQVAYRPDGTSTRIFQVYERSRNDR